MDAGKFNRLTLTQRADIVWQKGQFVDSVICKHYCLMLYSVQHQFIELYIDLRSQNIIWISLANEYDLEKFLTQIQIEV